MIRTPRLHLIPATVAFVQADLQGREALQQALGVDVPESWPPELFDHDALHYTLRHLEAPENATWSLHYFLWAEPRPVLIGVGGYKGAPDADGSVELGYSVLPEYKRRGFATEATRGMLTNAFAHATVHRVIAQTLPELIPSIGVLLKCGFRLVRAEESLTVYEITRVEAAAVEA